MFRRSVLSVVLAVSVLGVTVAPLAVQANVIRDQLAASPKDIPLPIKSLSAVSDQIQVSYHQDKDVDMADFALGRFLQPHRLLLFEPYYKLRSGLIPVIEMKVDVSNHYFTAMMMGYLQLMVEGKGTPYAQYLAQRAQTIMLDVPVANRVEAYRNALADWGGTLYSTAIAAEGSFRRNGLKICPVFDRPQSLFTLWETYFDDRAPFPGYYYAKGDWVYSRVSLKAEDKLKLMTEVLENFWAGNRTQDFKKRFCP